MRSLQLWWNQLAAKIGCQLVHIRARRKLKERSPEPRGGEQI